MGAEIFFRPDRRSVSRELIIGRRTARSLHQGCREAQAAKSSPYCAYSPHLKSLCCAVHSGPPVQLFLYKKLQNSILQRERERERNRDKQWGGGRKRQKTALKTQRIQTVNVTPRLLQSRKEAERMGVCSPYITC